MECEVCVTACCHNAFDGKFEIREGGHTVAEGTLRVSKAPELREPDGYTFPAGAHFCAGDWHIECATVDGVIFHVHAQVRDWTATD